MKNNLQVKDNLVNLIAKIGEKITIRRAAFFDNSSGKNFLYVHLQSIIILVKLFQL